MENMTGRATRLIGKEEEAYYKVQSQIVLKGLLEQNQKMKQWLDKIYKDTDFFDIDENEFYRFVEEMNGIESTGIIFGGVKF
jgi:hypothetical protein